ncbi:MAG: cation transporter [Candidatus Omnitrophica bacterium CG08_land_8_20_14_0_20_41_16]|uniref:Cation-efflux pump n=1 Tax=Candidatus Sherwoodlollariibacterium unditelluris TaxID=1974757 RepID=A0A2G9YIB0_9BACT|nr:MAG: cation-efflux pump [Candidatus Omnitrophica bacterium CG23_combo_of_CG06-09_8_20_14_all_41_10]PIS34369.1 MAG: cation transporter [Candidatus Omnitrophica bacterium CG08_land_8_20_14_0_20_41_16]
MLANNLKNYHNIRLVLILTLALNWLVGIAKIICGLGIRSSSMTADGFHSLSDGASNIIGLIGIHFASQPKDKDHPYGHRKYETFFALGIAFSLFLVAIGIVRESIGRFANPIAPQINTISFIIMILTTAVNFIVMRYENKKGKELKSDILVSDALHTHADIFTSLSVMFALFAIKLGYPILDPIISIMIAIFIAYAGYGIMRECSVILCDTAAILDVKRIVDIVLRVNGVKTCHQVRTRGRPDDIYVDLHVQVASDMHIDAAHKISCAIENAIKKSIPEVADVVVHMEPKE